jgi:deoxyribonuclease V
MNRAGPGLLFVVLASVPRGGSYGEQPPSHCSLDLDLPRSDFLRFESGGVVSGDNPEGALAELPGYAGHPCGDRLSAVEKAMRLVSLHPWGLSPREAARIQGGLAARVRGGRLPRGGTVLGVDVSYPQRGESLRGKPAVATAVLMSFPGLELLGWWRQEGVSPFPYVPGLLSFRELPVLLPLLAQIPRPSLILADGQGTAHPRRFGLACHIGLLAGVPAIGCAKSRLCGEHEEVPEEEGAAVPLLLEGKKTGFVLRPRRGSRPLYVSPGHLLTPGEALRGVRLCLAGHRLPEPVRLADLLTKRKDAGEVLPRRTVPPPFGNSFPG